MKYLITIALFLLPVFVLAETTYKPLVGIPGVETGENFSFDDLINALYALSISVAALLAVIKIVIAGVKYMLTDIVTSKGAAKKDIQNALFGLLLILGAVLILTIINPDLNKSNVAFTAIVTPPSNSPAVPISLNPNLFTTNTLSDGTVVMSFPPNQDAEQRDLFQKSCVTYQQYTLEGGAQCIIPATGKKVIPITDLSADNQTNNCTGNLKGTISTLPGTTKSGVCSYTFPVPN